MIIGLCVFLRTSQPSWLPVKFPPSYFKGEELTEGGGAYWKGWGLLKGVELTERGILHGPGMEMISIPVLYIQIGDMPLSSLN